jgi:hypothetical protein
MWLLVIITVVQFQQRWAPRNMQNYELADSETVWFLSDGRTGVVKAVVIRWLCGNTILGAIISLSTFVIGYRYGSTRDHTCLKVIENFMTIHGEERQRFYRSCWETHKTETNNKWKREELSLLDKPMSAQERWRAEETEAMYKYIITLVTGEDLSMEKMKAILEEHNYYECYASATVDKKEMFKLHLKSGKYPKGTKMHQAGITTQQSREVGGLKMNKIFHETDLQSPFGKYIVTAEDVMEQWNEETQVWDPITPAHRAKFNHKMTDDYLKYKVNTRIAEAFQKDWDTPLECLKPQSVDSLSFIEFEKWVLRFKWNLHPTMRHQMVLDWREDLSMWEFKHYFGNVIVPKYYAVARLENRDLFRFDKPATSVKPSQFVSSNANRIYNNADPEPYYGALVEQSLVARQILGHDSLDYFKSNNYYDGVTDKQYVKVYVCFINGVGKNGMREDESEEPMYYVITECDVLKLKWGAEYPTLLRSHNPTQRNNIASEFFKKDIMADLDQFCRDGERDFNAKFPSAGHPKEAARTLLKKRICSLAILEPLSAGFKHVEFTAPDGPTARFIVVSADPTIYTIPRGGRLFRTLIGVPMLCDFVWGLLAIYGTVKILEYKANKVGAALLMGIFAVFWLFALQLLLGYYVAKLLAKACCGYRPHHGHGFGVEYTRTVKKVSMDDLTPGRSKTRNGIFHRLSAAFFNFAGGILGEGGNEATDTYDDEDGDGEEVASLLDTIDDDNLLSEH